MLELQDEPQSDHGLFYITTARGLIHPIGDVAPGFPLTALGRQSVVRVMTVGIFRGRGSLRDQFGRGRGRTPYAQYES